MLPANPYRLTPLERDRADIMGHLDLLCRGGGETGPCGGGGVELPAEHRNNLILVVTQK